MSEGVLDVLGGLGLFLLGMFVMTDGLRQLAGRSLRAALRRFTRSPTSGAVTGALATAVVQSSSATTVTAVGFVGAGLLTFAEALGIIFGANIGTTITGWLVALFGFTVPLGQLAFPLVLIGSIGRIFLNGRWAAAAQALAGFGLLFVGIELLQSGLSGLEGDVTPDSFPPNTWGGRVQLVGIGILITLVTQSSSAGVAIAISAVHAGTITFPQAAAVVIGMDIGTTVTAAMAVVGGGTQVKRTGLAHVIYNCLTGAMAFLLLVPYVNVLERIGSDLTVEQPELVLVGFHTFFNGLGVLLVLPVAGRFAALVERLVPAPRDQPTHALGRSLLRQPDAALDVTNDVLRQLAARELKLLYAMWHDPRSRTRWDVEMGELESALEETRAYVVQIGAGDSDELRIRHQAAFHTIDHLDRLLARLARSDRLLTATQDSELARRGARIVRLGAKLAERVEGREPGFDEALIEEAEALTDQLVAGVRPYRAEIIGAASGGEMDVDELERRLDAVRWLARTASHVWRIALYLDHLAEREGSAPGAEQELEI